MPAARKKQITFAEVVRFAAGYWKRQPKRLSVVIAFLMAAALLETYLPTALAAFLGAIRRGADEAGIFAALGLFLGVYVAQAMLFSATYFIYNSFETRIFKQMVDDAFDHVYHLPEHYFVNTFTGSIISKINRARQKIENLEDQIILRVLPTIMIMIGSTAFLALHFPMLALLLVLYVGILMTVSAYFIFKISGPAQSRYADAQDDYIANLADSIGGMATTKSYAREEFERARFFGITRVLRGRNLRAYIRGSLAGFIQRMLLAGMLALLLGGGTFYWLQGRATVEDMAYLVFAYTIVQSYIQTLGENIKNILTASYDLHAVILLLREAPEVAEPARHPPLAVSQGAIAFENVTFAYPGKTIPVFEGLSVTIRPGERIALVGHSGSGKTTFARLLQCLYEVQAGRIAIDGQDIAAASRQSLRGAIALVPQDPVLFHRTLHENIAYGNPAADREAVRAAARQANIDDFIMRLPQQYETLVGERGIKLSGGERQRIAIARAILADRPILILDEATSALDSASERAIQDALRSLTHGRTSIMIAHRLSTILDADRILVFDNGMIVEEGAHAELLRLEGGIYASLFTLQSGGFLTE